MPALPAILEPLAGVEGKKRQRLQNSGRALENGGDGGGCGKKLSRRFTIYELRYVLFSISGD